MFGFLAIVGHVVAATSTKDDKIDKGVGTKSVGAVNGNAGDFAGRI